VTEIRHIEVPKTARLSTIGNAEKPSRIWIVLHGYGQLTPYFIQKFQPLADKGNFVVAPEGLNKFYLNGYNGRVGATWMTKDERENDIADNTRYLNAVYQAVTQEFDGAVPVSVLAFSQGVATASRWLANSDVKVDQFIAWAGSIPPDMDWKPFANRMNSMKLHYVFGRKDEFFDEDKIMRNLHLWKDVGISCDMDFFEGVHDIDQPTLEKIALQ